MIITQEHIAKLIELVQQAGDAIMTIYDTDDFSVEIKSDNSPLTKADKASHHILVHGLESIFPNIPVLSEESEGITYEQRKNRTTFWSVDPLDGTKEFIKRNGEFSICLGLIHESKPLFGMIYAPTTGEVWYGGDHISPIQADRNGTQIPLSGSTNQSKKLRLIGSRSHSGEEDEKFVQKLEYLGYDISFDSAGSSLKFCRMAQGLVECYPRFRPTMERDTAAGQAIIASCGFELIDQLTGLPMVYNRQNLRNNSFVAAKKELLDQCHDDQPGSDCDQPRSS